MRAAFPKQCLNIQIGAVSAALNLYGPDTAATLAGCARPETVQIRSAKRLRCFDKAAGGGIGRIERQGGLLHSAKAVSAGWASTPH